ncbi:MAG: SRPBCC family protein [Acidobacteria bacterium]|nr:SRPBCC family protein [Acidobacteriota bacterium]
MAWAPAAGPRPTRGLAHVHREALVHAPIDETFAFFSDARNLEKLTPPWLRFDVRTHGDLAMREGRIINYRIVLYGLPIPWQTRIDVWEPGVRFVDRQVRGPYRWWHHEHRFEAAGGGTRVIDHVEYVPRARWISAGLVRRDVERIFDYRQQTLAALFGA